MRMTVSHHTRKKGTSFPSPLRDGEVSLYLPSMVYLGLNDDHSETQNPILKHCSEFSN